MVHMFVFLKISSMNSLFSYSGMIALAYLSLLVPGFGQEVGDRVVATANFATKYKKEDVGRVFEGGIHTVSRVDGKWCMLDNIEGWLPAQNLMNLTEARDYYSKRIASPLTRNHTEVVRAAHFLNSQCDSTFST